MGDWEIEALNTAMEGAGCQFWVHTCWGNYSGTPGYFPDEEEREFGAWVLDRRPSSAAAPQRAQALFPKVLDSNIDALNYEVGRTGPDDLKPLMDHNWSKDFVAGIVDAPVHRLRSDQPASDDRGQQAARPRRRCRHRAGRTGRARQIGVGRRHRLPVGLAQATDPSR